MTEPRYGLISHDEDGETTLVDDGLTLEEAETRKAQEEQKFREAYGTECNFEIVEWDDY